MFVKDMELGGVFVWSADLDDFKGICGEKWPLMSALKNYLKGMLPFYYKVFIFLHLLQFSI